MWKSRNLPYLLILFSLIIWYGCSRAKYLTSMTDIQPLITLQKTSYLGPCPAFILTVFENGQVVFDPKQHTLIDSIRTITISGKQLSDLKEAFAQHFPELDTMYVSQIMDAPFTYLSYRNGEVTKRIAKRGPAPAAFDDLVRRMEQLAEAAEWLPIRTEDGQEELEIILELAPSATPEEVIATTPEYATSLIKRITPSKHYYLFTIRTKSPSQTLIKFRANPLVLNAQWNHKLKRRDQ